MGEVIYKWERHPKAEEFTAKLIESYLKEHPTIEKVSRDLFHQASTRLFDWIEYLIVTEDNDRAAQLTNLGYEREERCREGELFAHPAAQLPRILLSNRGEKGLSLKVDSIVDFLMVRGVSREIEGSPYSKFRRCLVEKAGNVALYVVERRGTRSIAPVEMEKGYLDKMMLALELWLSRPRRGDSDDALFEQTHLLAEDIVALLGKDLAAWVVLEGERRYWQARNRAGQIQKNRQNRLGMGWGNHDHHTFRSSRRHFQQLVNLFEMLGFHCRERFYAGEEAGWGAQVMENSNGGFVLFLDVDLAPHEVEIDFAHRQLGELESLGTIGLWCALHGDSILSAGMHHLEAQFMFDELREDLKSSGIAMMAPFSDYPFLKQAFTVGEVWDVDPSRIDDLLKSGKISEEEAKNFLQHGAIGSHLENLQRRDGYKGFNQKNVSYIIKKTDPRTATIEY